MDRKLLAIVLLAAGTTYNWGPGWGLIAAGVLLLATRPVVATGTEIAWRAAGQLDKARETLVAMPRHSAAVILAAAGSVLAPVALGLHAGAWLAVLTAGILAIGWGLMLGWEPRTSP